MISSMTKSFMRSWQHHPTMQMATLAVLSGAFAVITLFYCLQSNLQRILVQWGQSVQMTVYLQDDSKSEKTTKVRDFLEQTQEFESVTYIDKAEAEKRFKLQMGSYSSAVFADPEFGNPLPASFEVKLKDQFSSTERYDRMVDLAQRLTKVDGVEEVSYGQGWVENYGAFIKTFRHASAFLVILLLIGSLFVVSHSIRSSIFQRRDEIEILELVGATPAMIKAPYLFEGLLMGFLASAAAILFCYIFYAWQVSLFGNSMKILGLTASLQFLSFGAIVSFLLLGALFGWFGAYVCVRSLASGWAASERFGQ